ncbi:hypothetical protein PY365_30755 [Roseiarcaceae bacterium H3SJ34-1]|uniref:hypothetical protein n=1 Tax=Terripilifer ovatus TaxID=3032367 RepID=UPI003AB9B59B|nr:hypothetical protein [Roseiarcaceae bacterium H3SJ34-1]
MPEELGRIIRGTIEEIWTAEFDSDGRLQVKYEQVEVAGSAEARRYLNPYQIYASDAPRPIKDKLLAKVLWADVRLAG